MGVLNFLVSDSTKEYFEFGKILWSAETTAAMRDGVNVEAVICAAILDENYNGRHDPAEAATKAKLAATWMKAHPDWRSIADCDEDFDDVYLAENAEDAKEYTEEFGDDCSPIYTKTGSVWEGFDVDQ